MNNADEPVDRDPDADRRPLEPESQAGESGQSPSESEEFTPWISEGELGFQEEGMVPVGPAEPDPRSPQEPTGFAEGEERLPGGTAFGTEEAAPQEIHVAGPAEPVRGGPAMVEHPHATVGQDEGRAGEEQVRYIKSPAEPISSGPVTPAPTPRKRRLRPRLVGGTAAVVLLAAGAVSWNMGLFSGGKQGPGVNAEVAGSVELPIAGATQQPTPDTGAGQTPPAVPPPFVEKVAGIELIDPKRLAGPLSPDDTKTIRQLIDKIITDPSVGPGDLRRIEAWITPAAGGSSSPEVKELLLLIQMIRGEVGDVVARQSDNGKSVPAANKGALRRARPGTGIEQWSVLGVAPTSLRSLLSMPMSGMLQAGDQASAEHEGGTPRHAGSNAPPPTLNERGQSIWKRAQDTISEKRATPSRRATAYRTLAQLCTESGDFRRAEEYLRQAKRILDHTPQAGLTQEERASLEVEAGLLAPVSRQLRAASQVEDAAKRAAEAADEAKKSVKDVQELVTSAKSDVAAVRKDLEAIQKAAKGQTPPGKTDAEAVRKDREAVEKTAEEAKAQAIAAKAEADAARKDREAVQKSVEEAKAQAAAAKNDAQIAQKARREVQMGTGAVPADLVTKVELARAMEDLKKDASAARKSAEQVSANLGQFQSQADQERRGVADALKALKEEVAKLGGGPVGQGITAEQLEKIVGEVTNRVSAAAAQYDWQNPVVLRGPLGRIRQWYYPLTAPSPVPQVAARPAEAAPQAPPEGAGGTAPAQAPGKAAQPATSPASAASEQLVDAKLKSLGQPASQEPNPLMAGEIFSRGSSAYFLGETEEALGYFVAAIHQDPKNALYRYYLGLTLRRLGRPAEAEVQVRAGKRLESPTWRYGIGSSLQRVQGPDRDWLERLRLEM